MPDQAERPAGPTAPPEPTKAITSTTPPAVPLVGELEEAHARGGWQALLPLLAPLWGGFLLDVADFFSWTAVPPMLVAGAVAGVPLGWWIASTLGFSQKWRLLAAVGAGIYCLLPFTELLPLATIATTIASLVKARGMLFTPPDTKRG